MQQPNTVVVTRPVYSTMDDTDPRYRCCCGCMSVVTGAIIIGVLEILGALANVGGLIYQQVEDRTMGLPGSIYYGIAGSAITIIMVVLLFVGIIKKDHRFVLPHLIFQIIGIVLLIIGGIFLIVYLATSVALVARHSSTVWEVILFGGIALLVSATVEIWFFVVILKLYRYFKENRSSSFTSAAQYGSIEQQQLVGPQSGEGNPTQGYTRYP